MQSELYLCIIESVQVLSRRAVRSSLEVSASKPRLPLEGTIPGSSVIHFLEMDGDGV